MTGKRRAGGGLALKAGAIAREPGAGRFMTGARGLTEQQTAFVRAFVANGGIAARAAKTAGYQSPNPESWRLMQNSAVIGAIQDETARLIATGGAVGVATIIRLAQDLAAPAAAQFSAAKWLAEAGGHGLAVTKAGMGQDLTDKPLEDMSLAELQTFITAGSLALKQTRAKSAGAITVESVDVTHDDAPNVQQIGGESEQ